MPPPPIDNHVVIYSGGMDSFTLLHWVRQLAVAQGGTLRALSFDYGQRHKRELQSAGLVCTKLGISHRIMRLSALYNIGASALTDLSVPVPHGHYAAESMKKTVVPGRNTLMLATALAFAEGLHPEQTARIYYGAHAGDHAIYPDCRLAFIHSMAMTIHHASDRRVSLSAPFMEATKAQILKQGIGNDGLGLRAVDYADTWTCYEGGAQPCGKCGSCNERSEAFAECYAIDPLVGAITG